MSRGASVVIVRAMILAGIDEAGYGPLLGPLVVGCCAFEVEPLGPDRSRVIWSEWVDLPLGLVGRLGWPLVRPVLRRLVQVSLRRLAGQVEGTG